MTDGWDNSADAWIASQGTQGDFSRLHVLDTPMLARLRIAAPKDVLDLGCGEGRFCRLMSPQVPRVVGIDPTQGLIEHARALGGAEYLQAKAEKLPLEEQSFDMIVSYLSLIDIPDVLAALS
ncbi:MAG: class I SAM-dependent methyltransferase [Shimia sp.]|uniref:class I SAM-dependent methyltransferase n=1 Tax=Shimia sp. TaxID=1954381 RepID=UPI00405A370B